MHNDNYADYPMSTTEHKANRTQNGQDWTPRDALIELLRKIDSGQEVVNELILCYTHNDASNPSSAVTYTCAASDICTAIGIVESAKWLLIRCANGDL